MPTCHSWKTGLEHWKWGACKVDRLFLTPFMPNRTEYGPPSANKVVSTTKPRHGHAVFTLQVHPPTSPYPALSAEAEPISKRHCQKWHHEAETLMTYISAMGPKELIKWKVSIQVHIAYSIYRCPYIGVSIHWTRLTFVHFWKMWLACTVPALGWAGNTICFNW